MTLSLKERIITYIKKEKDRKGKITLRKEIHKILIVLKIRNAFYKLIHNS